MIKVHCFVSCVCEVIKKTIGVDHRPYYFGVWDADFDVVNGRLTYHSDQIDHKFFQEWYELLYGVKLYKWYDEKKSKSANIEELQRLIEQKNNHTYVMVMLDLSMLPERENKFHQRPFPHYVMLEKTEREDEWFMYDPDFRWEGSLPKERILQAINEPSVEGGYYFHASDIQPPTKETIQAYFHTCIKHDVNPITEAIGEIIRDVAAGKSREVKLSLALKQLPVLAIRKYAYEHAFAYFWEALNLEEEGFEQWCTEIEHLVKGFTTIQYRAMKYEVTKEPFILDLIDEKLQEQNELEFKIKEGLQICFNKWLKMQNLSQKVGEPVR
ncbi:DUF6005 family protein [Metabacillus halosaccharovorans]|uniref:DUF6005 family protein n=1 Tax=Metabacillus halosaccharovorans TaxID=930124 RepID=UPI0020423350|nr:DUF6005 family protein [Metabacillus halosaccharovorans]MCM3443434.1 DUF6005 family protein [Metabacillus halosaccharovorans]